jgi:hypothetical protein
MQSGSQLAASRIFRGRQKVEETHEKRMKRLSIGEVTIISIIERDGPWRTPQEMFPAYDPIIGKRHLAD